METSDMDIYRLLPILVEIVINYLASQTQTITMCTLS